MDIAPINSLPRIVENTPPDDRRQQQKRKQPQKREKIASVPLYTPDGRLEEERISKIDVVG